MNTWGIAARLWARGEGLTVDEWTVLGVKLPLKLPTSPPDYDPDRGVQSMKWRPERYDSEGNWRA